MAPIKKKVIQAKKPAQKSITAPTKPSKSSIPPMAKLPTRVQTGEGWRREKLKEQKRVKSS